MHTTRTFRWAVHAVIVSAGLTTLALQAQAPASPPDSAMARAAPIIAATPLFMSCEPRP